MFAPPTAIYTHGPGLSQKEISTFIKYKTICFHLKRFFFYCMFDNKYEFKVVQFQSKKNEMPTSIKINLLHGSDCVYVCLKGQKSLFYVFFFNN